MWHVLARRGGERRKDQRPARLWPNFQYSAHLLLSQVHRQYIVDTLGEGTGGHRRRPPHALCLESTPLPLLADLCGEAGFREECTVATGQPERHQLGDQAGVERV